MNSRLFTPLGIAALMLLAVGAHATDYYVDVAAGNDANTGLSASAAFKTIQKAISTAATNDTVYVAAGTYPESLDWENKDLVIEGAGWGQSVIDPSTTNGGPGGRCVYTSGLSSAARLQGFTFQNGNTAGSGGGMENVYSSPTITNCTFSGNSAYEGGGMDNYSSSPTVTNCTFSGNSATYGGGMDNYLYSSTVTNCTFIGNSSQGYGGGMFNEGSSPTLTNCILWGNSAVWRGNGICNDYSSSLTVTYSDDQDLTYATPDRNHNFAADPRFVRNPGTNGATDYGDLHLQALSPCINAGNNAVVTAPPFPTDNGVLLDLDGQPRIKWSLVDLGAYEFQDNLVPTLSQISPTSLNAGGPAFTLTATSKTYSFVQGSTINWNGTALSTAFVSPTKLKASVPASYIASPGKAKITVVTPGPGGGTSVAKSLSIKQTSITMTFNSLVEYGTSYYAANVTLTNAGYLTANNLTITASSLGAASTSDTLPITIGNLPAGASISGTLYYPASAGVPGTKVSLKVVTKFTGGSSTDTLKVTLP
ncbi:MAG TPA: right-handed parallel beta-helix repeat-containing protein [Chthonomonadaceae bacterium]|nr:right-handed parallel beta-helix repeat-containing protein [Chthonomonadaceae bacterium]